MRRATRAPPRSLEGPDRAPRPRPRGARLADEHVKERSWPVELHDQGGQDRTAMLIELENLQARDVRDSRPPFIQGRLRAGRPRDGWLGGPACAAWLVRGCRGARKAFFEPRDFAERLRRSRPVQDTQRNGGRPRVSPVGRGRELARTDSAARTAQHLPSASCTEGRSATTARQHGRRPRRSGSNLAPVRGVRRLTVQGERRPGGFSKRAGSGAGMGMLVFSPHAMQESRP